MTGMEGKRKRVLAREDPDFNKTSLSTKQTCISCISSLLKSSIFKTVNYKSESYNYAPPHVSAYSDAMKRTVWFFPEDLQVFKATTNIDAKFNYDIDVVFRGLPFPSCHVGLSRSFLNSISS